MKTAMIKVTVAALLCASTAFGAFAQEFTKGVVNKVDTKAKKVTIKHEDLKGLDMPAMTMVFRVEDPALLEKLKEGSNIEFVAERVNGKLMVTEVK
ncbi:copper-binding periplasmic protein CusF (plasmid) [Rhizobium etli 8C-3]|uniref:Cu/Ag efflux protein CusF n=2 Tax=Rhizobium TaxID=379 RepID=A0A4R3QQZ9_9HYPH|nr:MULTISPECIES: copper-binding protein [Rhizobium]APO78519.1 copper-binding periplasmic protein CusF [Rhizobium etli 8C-3]TCU24690.1 Cu/Ag efflux protein CusF [Rhizobium azibense]TCU39436.1 Cu/Ag efflux protein CusF [Rhizobium azibense]